MDKILILGENGLIGRAISKRLRCQDFAEIYGTYHSKVPRLKDGVKRFYLDIKTPEALILWLEENKPSYVISCLRGDFEDQLELHKQLAEKIQHTNTKLLFFSTANVFDGDLSRIHYEDDKTMAKSDYGRFKAECEDIIREILPNDSVIVRLPMVLDYDCKRIRDLKKAAKEGSAFTLYNNLHLNIETARSVARKTLRIIESKQSGLYHFGTSDEISHKAMYEQLSELLELKGIKFEVDEMEKGHFTLGTRRVQTDKPIVRLTIESALKEITISRACF